ncbi:hypothetical protein H0H81_003695 [Sphagnurus paluster]|uniref:Uncharacterized protein n=1 Tax=Sphagnurus paluster TaxID=117069 RepID=A0A9P7KJA7_9AGAR|nr:hypothetical protein H0H81_003695 [Sphagnurus paluster]
MCNAPLKELFSFIRSFLPAHIALVISSGIIRSSVRESHDMFYFKDNADLINVLAQTSTSRTALINEIHECLTADNVQNDDHPSEYFFALAWLSKAPIIDPTLIVDAGGTELVLKMLKSQELTEHEVLNAANLATYLALSNLSTVLPLLHDGGAIEFVEHAQSKALELSACPTFNEGMDTGDPDKVAAQLKKAEFNVALAEDLEEVLKVLRDSGNITTESRPIDQAYTYQPANVQENSSRHE